jgi:hypothetical protein
MASDSHTNEIDLVVKYAGKKGGGDDGQLIIDSVELNRSRDNRVRHGIGNEDPQEIERGNRTYTFDTTTMLSAQAAEALENIFDGTAETQAVYIRDDGNWKDQAEGMVFNDVSTSASDDGDTTVDVSADLLGLDFQAE